MKIKTIKTLNENLEILQSSSYKYNKEGLLISIISRDINKRLLGYSLFKYDENNNKICFKSFNHLNEIEETIIYKYDNNNRLIYQEFYNNINEIEETSEIIYKKNNLKIHIYKNEYGQIYSKTIFDNNLGIVTNYRRDFQKNCLEILAITENLENNKGLLISQVTKYPIHNIIEETTYRYIDECICSTLKKIENDRIIEIRKDVKINDHKIISSSIYNEKGELIFWKQNKFDKNKNIYFASAGTNDLNEPIFKNFFENIYL